MKCDIRRLLLLIRKSKIFICVLAAMLYVILPMYQSNILSSGLDFIEKKDRFFTAAQTYLPFLGLLLLFFILRFIFEEELEEVNMAYDRKSRFRFPVYIWYY